MQPQRVLSSIAATPAMSDARYQSPPAAAAHMSKPKRALYNSIAKPASKPGVESKPLSKAPPLLPFACALRDINMNSPRGIRERMSAPLAAAIYQSCKERCTCDYLAMKCNASDHAEVVKASFCEQPNCGGRERVFVVKNRAHDHLVLRVEYLRYSDASGICLQTSLLPLQPQLYPNATT